MKKTTLAKVAYVACSLIFLLSIVGVSVLFGASYYKAHGSLLECDAYQREIIKQEQDRIRARERFDKWCKEKSKWPCKMM